MTKAKARSHGRDAHPHEKPHHPHWPLACLLFAFVAMLGLLSVHEPATWLHVRTGARILAERALPRTDPFSYTVSGRAWTTDSWLADALFFFVHSNFGPNGLVALKSLVAAAGFALLLPLNFASPLTSAGVLGLGAVSSWAGFVELPAVFDLLLLAVFIRLLRPRSPFRFRTLLLVAGLEWLWANLHGTTAVLGLWLVLLKAFKASLRASGRQERLGHWGLFAAALFGLAANPHGLGVIAHMFTGLDASTTAWQPLSVYFNLYNLFCLAGAAGCVITLQQEFFLTMTAATTLVLSLIVPELRPLAILASCPVVSLALGHYLPQLDDDLPGLARWALLMTGLLALHWLCVTVPLSGSRGYSAVSLDGAAQYLKASGVRGRMFNEVDSGALLIGAGDRPVFVDSRASLYGPTFLRDAQRWPYGFKPLADVYGFDYAVILNRRARNPAKTLDEDPGWRLAYADDAALVYVRRGGASGWLVKDWPAPLVLPNKLWPDSMDAALDDAKRLPKVMAELDRWILAAPDSAQALIWKAYALDRRKLADNAQRLLALAQGRKRVLRDPELCAMAAFALDRRGEAEAAGRLYRRAALIARRRGERHLEADILLKLADSRRRAGDTAGAAALESKAREVDVPAFAEEL